MEQQQTAVTGSPQPTYCGEPVTSIVVVMNFHRVRLINHILNVPPNVIVRIYGDGVITVEER